MSQKYLITLKPLEPFFFGGEHTFGADDSRNEASRYSASSSYFPQQSALLGMLRRTILIQEGCLTLHRRGEWVDASRSMQASIIAGKGKFSYDDEYDLGKIKGLSPLFIAQNNNYYIVDSKDKILSPKISSTSVMLIGGSEQPNIVFEGYNPKNYSSDSFIANDGKGIKKLSELYKEVSNVGIKKSINGESEEDAFFQKTSFLLKDEASFACIVTLEDGLNLNQSIVTLGADQSSFMMNVQPFDKDFIEVFSTSFSQKSLDRVVITAETLVSSEASEYALFILGERKSYRFLKAEKNASSKGKKSKRYFLLERGSVIYTNNMAELSSHLSQPHLQRAGINHFIAIKGA
jgi:CRISPR-associated protein Cmr3